MKRPRPITAVLGGRATGLQRALSGGLLASLVATIAVPLSAGQRMLRPGPRWDSGLAPLASFVERERGRTFREPVPVTFVAVGEFDREAATPVTPSPSVATISAPAAQALSSAGIPTPSAPELSVAPTPLARYDETAKQLLVRGNRVDEATAPFVVEALMDALQHQVFDLSDAPDGATDAGLAWRALVDGDARRVANAYRRAHGGPRQVPAVATDGRALSAFALLAEANRLFPVTWGTAMMEQTYRVGGNGAADALFLQPPKSTAEVLRRAFGDASDNPLVIEGVGPANLGGTGWFAVMSRFADFGEALAAARSLVAEDTRTASARGGICFDSRLEVLMTGPWRSRTPTWSNDGPHPVGTISTCQNGEFDFASSDGVDALRAFATLPTLAVDLAARRKRPVAWALCVGLEVTQSFGPAALVGDVRLEPAQSSSGRASCDDVVDTSPAPTAPSPKTA